MCKYFFNPKVVSLMLLWFCWSILIGISLLQDFQFWCRDVLYQLLNNEFYGSLLVSYLSIYYYILFESFSLETEWQQVTSSLQDLSQYSGRSQ